MSQSNNHFENFIKPTNSDWETAAEKELNGKSIATLKFFYAMLDFLPLWLEFHQKLY
jgi:hypothetical protein